MFNTDSIKNIAPLYFTEKFFRTYHSNNLQTNVEHLIATKQLGLETDKLASKLERFEFKINIYDAVIPILKKSTFEKIEIPVPPISLQKKYSQLAQFLEQLKTRESILRESFDAIDTLDFHPAFTQCVDVVSTFLGDLPKKSGEVGKSARTRRARPGK